jgi:pyruvate dehydrogenase E2 component (dihydrolipoamide acetyltransferase)
VTVESVLISPGDTVARDDTLIVLETGKVALDIPCPCAGVVLEVAVRAFDPIAEGDLIAVIETAG